MVLWCCGAVWYCMLIQMFLLLLSPSFFLRYHWRSVNALKVQTMFRARMGRKMADTEVKPFYVIRVDMIF